MCRRGADLVADPYEDNGGVEMETREQGVAELLRRRQRCERKQDGIGVRQRMCRNGGCKMAAAVVLRKEVGM